MWTAPVTMQGRRCYCDDPALTKLELTVTIVRVVYSEMQALQNTASEIMDQRLRRLLYPEDIGFRYETGGMMQPLRGLSADRIREFHREMYQPRNLCIMIVGEVDHDNLITILEKFDGEMQEHFPDPHVPWARPWTKNVETPPLKSSIIDTVEFPEEDESMGEIIIAFLGPSANNMILRRYSPPCTLRTLIF